MKQMLPASYLPAIKIGLITALAIIAMQFLNTLVVYNFFTFDKYLTAVAVAFLITGYLLAQKNNANPPVQGDVGTNTTVTVAAIPNEANDLPAAWYDLSNRELTIFRMISAGNTNKEIAGSLCIEVSTVKTHINNLYAKIGCSNRKEARQKWQQMVDNGLIS